MNLPSIIILAVLCVLIGLALWQTVRRKKRGKGCGGDCMNCGRDCGKNRYKAGAPGLADETFISQNRGRFSVR